MEYIKPYFLNIISVIIFTVLVEILMPNNSLKSYIKLVLGMVVVLSVIKPITNLMNFDISSFMVDDEVCVSSAQIEYVQNKQIDNVFCDNLELLIRHDIQMNFNEDITVEVDADTNEIRSVCIGKVSNEQKSDIEKHIVKTYGVNMVVTIGGE